ncbi:hypothetical protein [uncultured Winogradskyella sp.]|uniref:hypothetical protein n=1 Tax=uncultured Winogradskyella sp. TaxID=395353 RepID=UPI0026031685|nr:hypothetical protein [uncultured Winogradskyella sp.]
MLQRSWVANQSPSYLSILPFSPSIDERRIPLRQGEGTNSDFNLIEANLNLSFPLFFGKNDSWDVNKRQMITFDYNGTFRMTLDDSKPIIPSSHKVGISWYFSLYNNYTGWIWKNNDSFEKINSKDTNIHFLNHLVRLHHYSNGQAPGFFFIPDENIPQVRRNSYLDGDFSTNYIYNEITYGRYNKEASSLHQFSLGYRRDLGTEESVLAFSEQQEKSYGKDRLLFKYDYRKAMPKSRLALHLRTELVYILGNLDSFLSNINDDGGSKYRMGIKGLFELSPDNHRTVGYFVSIFYGRDYLNIRYDDIIYSTQFGITLSLDKFFMPTLN